MMRNRLPQRSRIRWLFRPGRGFRRCGRCWHRAEENCQLFKVLTAQVDLVVAQGHGVHTAKFRQCQSTSAPVSLHHKAFQVQKVPAVQIEVRFCPVFLKIGADPAQKGKIGVDVVGVVDVQTHKSLLTFDSANEWCAAT